MYQVYEKCWLVYILRKLFLVLEPQPVNLATK